MNTLHVDWHTYHRDIESLASQIHRSGWKFDGIVCLARGGLRIGDTLSRIFQKPLAILSTASYHCQNRGELIIAPTITMTTPTLPDRILLVDDLADSGETLQQTIRWLHDRYEVSTLKTAVIWVKAHSSFTPDFYVQWVADNAWIIQPFEIYETWEFS